MYSAFLRTGDSWNSVMNVQEVLDHDGEIIINESKEDHINNLGLIAAKRGLYGNINGSLGKVSFTRTPLRKEIGQAVDDIATFGEGCCVSSTLAMKAWIVKPYTCDNYIFVGQDSTYEPTRKQFEKYLGVVMVMEKLECGTEVGILTRNETLWDKCMAKYKANKRNEYLASIKRPPSSTDFISMIQDIAKKCEYRPPGSLTLDQLWVWVAAHDAAFGKRATNKLVRTIALKWCYDREKSRKWMRRWSSQSIVDRIDKRLADVLRLKDKNSRHEPKMKNVK